MNSRLLFLLGALVFLASTLLSEAPSRAKEVLSPKRPTSVVLVRHAEKQPAGENPGLTAEGKKRAARLARMLERAKVDALFSSHLRRTYETLRPLSRQTKLKVRRFEKVEDLVRAIQSLPAGSLAVVAQHSYNLKKILASLGTPDEETEDLSVEVYDNLIVVSYHPQLETRLVCLTY